MFSSRKACRQKARATGDHLKARLQTLAERHQIIGDVRGEGLFLGVELVRDRSTLEPATDEASRIANDMRERGVLISTDGPFDNVLKIKPPMVFGLHEANIMVDALEAAFVANVSLDDRGKATGCQLHMQPATQGRSFKADTIVCHSEAVQLLHQGIWVRHNFAFANDLPALIDDADRGCFQCDIKTA